MTKKAKAVTTTIKVNYDPESKLVLGYYPDSISYNLIPKPYIEITNEEHVASFSKTMLVEEGVLQEYRPTIAEALKEAKNTRIIYIENYLNKTDKNFIKALETGVANYKEKSKRQQAREEITKIKTCKTLAELNQFNSIFE